MKRLLFALFLLAAPAQAQIINTLPFQLQNGTTADASQVMADFNQIVNNTNANAAKNGANSDITSLSGLTTPITPAQGGTNVYVGTAGGSANAITVTTTSPTGFSLATGKRVVTVATNTNTGPATLATGGTTATNIYKLSESGPVALTGGEIHVGSVLEAIFDGTQYQLVTNNLSLLGPLTNLSSATPDLGTIPSHNINITGATAIASFGSTASTNFPIYYITFASTPTLTYNASSMILPGAADIVTAAGDTAIAQYLGSGNWSIIFYQRASGATVVATTPLCGAGGLTIQNNSGTPNTSIDVAAAIATLVNTTGVTRTVSSPSVTINATITGANGLDAGALANTTWYHVYLIDNGATTAGLASTSATAPTMPSGYTYKCRLGAMITDGTAIFYRTLQRGAFAQYKVATGTNVNVARNIANGVAGTWSDTSPTLASASISSFVPPTATSINVMLRNRYAGSANAAVIVAPATTWGGANTGPSGTGPGTGAPTLNNANPNVTWVLMLLESASTVGWASSAAGGAIDAAGWVDAVNAN